MAFDTLPELLEDELKDIYKRGAAIGPGVAQTGQEGGIPRAEGGVHGATQRKTQGHVARLEKIGKQLGIKLTGKTCHAMKGLVEEGKEVLDEDGQSPLIDAALIGAAQRVEHYEIAAYGTVRAMAEQLGNTAVAQQLQETLDEESAADKKLTEIAEGEVLALADSETEGQ